MQARSAVQCRSARLSEAVSPAKSARVAIGLIVVKSVAKSLLILIKSGDMCWKRAFSLIRTVDQARGKVGGVKLACAYPGDRSFVPRSLGRNDCRAKLEKP